MAPPSPGGTDSSYSIPFSFHSAHALATCLQHFAQGITALEANADPSGLRPAKDDPGFLPLLRRLFALFALVQLSRDAAADVLELGLLAPADVARAREEVVVLLAEVRPDAVAVCDGFDWHDFELKSTLGRADGDVYRCVRMPCVRVGVGVGVLRVGG